MIQSMVLLPVGRLVDDDLGRADPASSTRSLLPPWWVGALVLIGYGVVAGVIGTLITRKRDIS